MRMIYKVYRAYTLLYSSTPADALALAAAMTTCARATSNATAASPVAALYCTTCAVGPKLETVACDDYPGQRQYTLTRSLDSNLGATLQYNPLNSNPPGAANNRCQRPQLH